MDAVDIKSLIEKAIPDSMATVVGEDGRHFEARIVADAFAGKSRVQRQQMVYAALGSLITDGTIHALSLQTNTRAEIAAHLSQK